ncbi:MalY/PatB family protein [Bacillus sp. P14.5]|uniref:MalY/PatB family protein n=1 Tax=Bacillus sp. P14.5 TaxID=1983400 RepID=UPI000DE9E761|nr:MalY/PatB family protein [Bacillus sp. P14.5]
MHNFDFSPDRKGTSSVKWDLTKTVFGRDDVLPMWVADMDFPPPPQVLDSLHERIEHGVFGYTFTGDSLGKAVCSWMKERHNWAVKESSLLYSSGIVPAIATIINAFTEEGDGILMHSPVYTPFFSLAESNGRVVRKAPLIIKHGQYTVDFHAFEEALKQGVKLFLLCSPHNPGGRVWTKDELLKMAELCKTYNVLIISDEIHADLVHKPNKHIPIASLEKEIEEITLTLAAPSKTFNIAGLQASAMIIPNKDLREKVAEEHQKQGIFTLNTFGVVGMEAAYRHGDAWLDSLLSYLSENIREVTTFVEKELPELSVMDPEATYLLWFDFRKVGKTETELQDLLLNKGKLALEPGSKFGEDGEGFFRMNIACTRETLRDGLERLKKALS